MAVAPIVVGYDGSKSSDTALDWATTEAQLRHRPLRIVHVVPDAGGGVAGYGLYSPPDHDVLVQIGQKTLALATARISETAPEIELDTRLLFGRPVTGLLDNLVDAEMAVIGNRGLGTFAELLLGSTGVVLATHATCPVVVIRPTATGNDALPEAGRVVVGVDGSPLSIDALGFAFDEASVRHRGLTAIHAWATPFNDAPGHGGAVPASLAVEEFEGEELRLLSESMAGWREKYPDVDVRQIAVHRDPVEALVVASTGAALLVVGTRGRGGFRSMLLGSVSHAALHHARCPIAIVRPVTATDNL
jgi:nucleotide-binding universal stress UspA family protein